MRVLTTASYTDTGSSAITDLFREFDNCGNLGDYEFRFLQDPDGISDLEYNIVENNHRYNTSNAIKRFLKLSKRLNGTWYAREYNKIFGDSYKKFTQEYIDELCDLKAKFWWHQDQIENGEVFRFIDRVANKLYRTIAHGDSMDGRCFSFLQANEQGYISIKNEEEFLNITRRYIDRLFSSVNTENMDFLIVDQLMPPTNVKRYIRYFNDVRVIIPDRDPRDIYITEKKYKWGVFPAENVQTFCRWYELTRRHRVYEQYPAEAMLIRFEDLIYEYEKTLAKLVDFTGLDKNKHTEKFKYLDPSISKRNTNMIERFPELREDIDYIKQNLSMYLCSYF